MGVVPNNLPIQTTTFIGREQEAADVAEAERGCREALGEETFDAAVKEGAGLSMEEAVAYASRGRGTRGRPAAGWASLTPAELDVGARSRPGSPTPSSVELIHRTKGETKMPLCLIGAAAKIATTLAFQAVGLIMAVAVSLPGGSSIPQVRSDPASAPAAVVATAHEIQQGATVAGFHVTVPSASGLVAQSERVVTKVRQIAAQPVACTAGTAARTATTVIENASDQRVPAALPNC